MNPSAHPTTHSPARRLLAGLAVTATAAGLVAIAARPVQALPGPGGIIREPTTRTTAPPMPDTPPTATFTWSRAARSAGGNATSDVFALSGYVHSTFQVVLDACASREGSSPITGFQWTLPGGASVGGCRANWFTGNQGTFPVSVRVTDSAGRSSTTTQSIVVKDRFVVTVGDSIAAGEGNPAVPGNTPVWPNKRCHRSTTAASQRAMATYEQSRRQESITFVNLACSGAKLSNMLLGGESYAGIEPDGTLERPQLAQLQEIIARTGRKPDVVYLSGGANDLGFADITRSCLDISSAWETAKCATLNPLVKAGDELLVGPRPALDLAPTNFEAGRFAALRRDLAAMGIDNSKVVVSQYPNPTRGDTGTFCPEILQDTPGKYIGKRIHSTDVAWAGDPKVGPVTVLNQDVATAAARNGWKLVPGIATDFDTHGYCATSPWINTYTFAVANQGDEIGTLHPNNAGTNNYSRRIQESIAANGLL